MIAGDEGVEVRFEILQDVDNVASSWHRLASFRLASIARSWEESADASFPDAVGIRFGRGSGIYQYLMSPMSSLTCRQPWWCECLFFFSN